MVRKEERSVSSDSARARAPDPRRGGGDPGGVCPDGGADRGGLHRGGDAVGKGGPGQVPARGRSAQEVAAGGRALRRGLAR